MLKSEHVTNPPDGILDYSDSSRVYSRKGPATTASRRTAGDGLSDILETLYSEHRYLASLLDVLEKESARLRPRKIPDYHLLLDIIDYLAHYPQQYHHPREDLLFGTMAKRDTKFRTQLNRLEREHRTLEAFNHELLAELTGISTGRAVDRPALLRSIERYVAAYRQHMDFESGKVFPMAKGSLKAADRKRLGEKTRYIDDPLFGGEVQYRYHRLGRQLQVRVEIAEQELLAGEFSAIQSAIGTLSGWVDTLGHLKQAVGRHSRQSRQEQRETISRHLQRDRGPGLAALPLALARNQGRQLREGLAEIRRVLRKGDDGSAPRKLEAPRR